jgi:hypothetical protein
MCLKKVKCLPNDFARPFVWIFRIKAMVAIRVIHEFHGCLQLGGDGDERIYGHIQAWDIMFHTGDKKRWYALSMLTKIRC